MSTLSDDPMQDKILLDRIDSIPTQQENDRQTEPFTYDQMDDEKLPKKKLEFITDRVKSLAEDDNDADTILTKLIDDICVCKPQHLISNLRYIQRFRNHEWLHGEAAYTMTMMIAVIQHIDQLASAKEGQSQLIYNLVANSTSSLNSTTKLEESPSFMTRQMSDLNSMAASVFNTIGFVPRAIGAAVADTIRSRQPVKKSASEEEQERVLTIREHLAQITSFEEATIKDLRDMFEDYQRLTRKP